jgi:predicted transcriptional regulator
MTNSTNWKQPYHTERHQVDNSNARQVDFQDCTFSVNIQINPTANDASPIITYKKQKFCIRNEHSNMAIASITSIKSVVYTNNFHLQVLSTKLQQRTMKSTKI